MLRRAAAILALPVLLLAACETENGGSFFQRAPAPPPPPPPPPTGGINGDGTFHSSQGGRVSCAGYSVALMPDLARYRRRIIDLYRTTSRAMEPIAEVRARSAEAPASPDTAPVASVTCDAKGAFSINGLTPGGYFILARVKVKPAPAAGGDYVIIQPVDVRPGEVTDVSLAP